MNASSGKVSKILLILAIVAFVAIIAVFVITRIVATRQQQTESNNTSQEDQNQNPQDSQEPVYEVTLSDIRFVLQSADDLGSVLKATSSYSQDLKTTERFIKVVVAAQNKGKTNTTQSNWEIGNIIDSEGRNFASDNQAYFFIPKPDLCASVLKPEFQPTPCVRIYEVSKASVGLKVEVKVNYPKRQTALLDLNLGL